MSDEMEQAALVALLRRARRSWQTLAEEVEAAGSAVTVLREGPTVQTTLFEPAGDDLSAAQQDIAAWRREGIRIVTLLDSEYPTNLRGVHQRPPILFLRGTTNGADATSVAVVGTRKPSDRGLEQAAAVATGLTERGIPVVSGLAAGIDTAAHQAALDAGGRTVAVIGTGLRRTYPAANAPLQRRIADHGLVVSQFWPEAPPQKHHFPMRNAVMSGFTLATVVIEAAYVSGARMQARLALEHGRHVFLMRSLLVHEWAQVYVDRPGTTVVDSAEEVFEGLQQLAGEPAELTWQ